MNSDHYIYLTVSIVLLISAAIVLRRVYQIVKNSGIMHNMAFRLIELIIAAALLFGADYMFQNIPSYSRPQYLQFGFTGLIVGALILLVLILVYTVKTRLSELGLKNIGKKLLYAMVISSVVAWANYYFDISEPLTLIQVALGGMIVFSIQLLG